MPNRDNQNSLQTLPAAFRKALLFFCWGRAIRAMLTLFCDFTLLLILCRAADPFCAEWSETGRCLLVWTALFGMFLHAVWIFLAPWFTNRGIQAFFTMLAHGSEKARKIAAPLLTRKMLADDTGAVIRVLTRGLEHFLPPAALSRAAASEGIRMALLSIVVLILFLIPFGGDGGPDGKLLTFRAWLMGSKWANSLPLEIQSLFPGSTIIKPESEWIVKAVFNREVEDAHPLVRCKIGGKQQDIPLIAVSRREYQALMPPFSGECRYTIQAEKRFSEEFTILAQNSAPVVIRHISYLAAGTRSELFQEHRKWTVPAGARIQIVAEAPVNCVELRISGSGGLNTALKKDPETGLWNTAFTVWESGAFFFRTMEMDGTRGGSELYTLEILQDTPPSVQINAPANLEPLFHPAAVTVEAKDDFALKNILLRLNNLNGTFETLGPAALSGTERESREQFQLSVTKSARLITSVVAVAAEAEENSPARKNAFSDIHFHPVVVESESEMLNNPQVIRAFQEWRKNRKYQEPNKKIPPPETPDTQNKQDQNDPSPDSQEQSGDQKPKENPNADSGADEGGKMESDGNQQEKPESKKRQDQQAEKENSGAGKQNAEQNQKEKSESGKQNVKKEQDSEGKQQSQNEQGSGGKQNTQNEQGAGGKQNTQDAQSSGGKQSTQDAQGSGGKQNTQDAQGSGGKQNTQDAQSSGGKQSTQDAQGSGGKQSTQDAQGSGGKQNTQDAQGSGGKQNTETGSGTPAKQGSATGSGSKREKSSAGMQSTTGKPQSDQPSAETTTDSHEKDGSGGQENGDSPETTPGVGKGGTQGQGKGGTHQNGQGKEGTQGHGREGIQEKQKRKSGTEQPGSTHGKSNADRKQGQARNGQEQTENHASQGSSQSGKPSTPGGGGNTTLNTGRNAKDSSDPEQADPEVVVGTARRGDGKKSDPLPETKLPPDELPQNTEKDKPYSAEDDNSLHEETSDGKREALLLKEAGIEAVPARKYTPEQKNELERAIRRYDAVRARMSDADRRAADEYYRRLREILKQ